MLLPLLVLIFVAVPIAEIYVLIQIGEAIGALPTIALLVVDALVGGALVRHQGRAAWRRLVEALGRGRPPAREAIDGALVVAGGALLLAPGFLTDVLGLALVVPPTRALVRAALVRRFTGRALGRVGAFVRGRGRRGSERGRRAYDVEGSAVDVDREPHPLAR